MKLSEYIAATLRIHGWSQFTCFTPKATRVSLKFSSRFGIFQDRSPDFWNAVAHDLTERISGRWGGLYETGQETDYEKELL